MVTLAWRFRRFLRPFLPMLALGVLCSLAKAAMDLAQPWPLKVIVDQGLSNKPQTAWLARLIGGESSSVHDILVRSLVALVLFVCLSGLFDFASDYLMNAAGQRVMVAIRTALFDHVQRLSFAFHDQQRVGELVSRITTDIDRLQDLLIAVFDTLVPNVVMLAGLAVVMVALDWQFGLLALLVGPPLFVVTYLFTLRIKKAARRLREADARVAAHASETLSAVRMVQAFSREDHEAMRFAERNQSSLLVGIRTVRLKAAFPPVVDVIAMGGTALVIYAGVQRVIGGHMSLGLLLIFLAYVKSLYVPMRALSKLAYQISQGTVSGERILALLELNRQLPDRPGARPAQRLRGEIELRNVTFRYLPERGPVLEQVSLHVEAGARIGIVGRSGAGKSTLMSLLPRFYDPEAGAVLLDGVDVRDFTLASVRKQVSLVLQEPVLLAGTIMDNILYGNAEASLERVYEVAEAANVMEFARKLPDELLTRLGERGASLSGGQRQRITIARAMLSDAPILILDEPTSGLDAESETLVLAGLELLMEGRTTFVISHRAAALVNVDRVVRIEDGAMREVENYFRGQPKPLRKRRTVTGRVRTSGRAVRRPIGS